MKREWNRNEVVRLVVETSKIEGLLGKEDSLQMIDPQTGWLAEVSPDFQEDEEITWHVQLSYPDSNEVEPELKRYRGFRLEDWDGAGPRIQPGYSIGHGTFESRPEAIIYCLLEGYTNIGYTTNPF